MFGFCYSLLFYNIRNNILGFCHKPRGCEPEAMWDVPVEGCMIYEIFFHTAKNESNHEICLDFTIFFV